MTWNVARLAGVTGAIAVGALLGGIGFGAIPGSDGVISACYVKEGKHAGRLRVIDVEAGRRCKASENPLSWGVLSADNLEGTPCTLRGRAGTTVLSKGDGSESFFMNASCALPDGFEPNETREAASELSNRTRTLLYATNTPANDEDWYALTNSPLLSLSVSIDWGVKDGQTGIHVELYRDGILVQEGDVQGDYAPAFRFQSSDPEPHDWLFHVRRIAGTEEFALYSVIFYRG